MYTKEEFVVSQLCSVPALEEKLMEAKTFKLATNTFKLPLTLTGQSFKFSKPLAFLHRCTSDASSET